MRVKQNILLCEGFIFYVFVLGCEQNAPSSVLAREKRKWVCEGAARPPWSTGARRRSRDGDGAADTARVSASPPEL